MTLQRPTFEELERRRQLRESLSPQRSTTLQRRESMLSRGFNAIMRRQSFMSPSSSSSKPANMNSNLRRHDSFFMHSALAKDPDVAPPLSMMTNDHLEQVHPLHTIVNNNNNNNQMTRGRSNLARAKSFKYPERVSQIPPAELTRLRSKSQVRDHYNLSNNNNSSGGEDPVYTSGSGGSAADSGKSLLRRPPPSGSSNNGSSYFEEVGYGSAVNWLSREKFFQPPPRIMPQRPMMQRPSPRDLSEPPPHPIGTNKRRLPLPDIFYYGERWQEQETRSRSTNQGSLETPEPPPGTMTDMSNNNNR